MSSETASALLDLPGEIRNQIYRYAVVQRHLIIPRIFKRYDNAGRAQYAMFPKMPALAAVCKSIRKEVLPLYYAENCFHCDDENTAYFSSLVSHNVIHLRHCNFSLTLSRGIFPLVVELEVTVLPDGNGKYHLGFDGEDCCVCDFHEARELSTLPAKHGGHILEALGRLRRFGSDSHLKGNCKTCGRPELISSP